MKKATTYIFLLLIVSSTSIFAKSNVSDSISFTVHLKAKETIRLNYLNEYLIPVALSFKNHSIRDSTFSKKIGSTKPIEFRYSLLDIDHNKRYYYNFILSPGDDISLKLQDNFELISDQNNKLIFANKVLNLYNVFDEKQSEYTGQIINSGIEKYDSYLNGVYTANVRRIDSLVKLDLITNKTEKTWRNIILTDYYRQLFYPIYITHSSAKKAIEFKKKTLDAKEHIQQLQKVNSYGFKDLLNSLIRYEMLLLGKTKNDLDFYTQYLFKSNYSSDIILGSLIEKFNTYPEKNSVAFMKAFDEFKNFCKKNGKEEIASQLSSKYYPSNAVYDKILLVNAAGKSSTLNEILKKEKGKIIFIDLWASWCKPCRAEIPVLEKIKKKFPAQHIEFISISLDKNAATKAWEMAMKQENLTDPHQYRMLDVSNLDLSKAFQVKSIPRYLVFDRNGNTLNDNFPRPSDGKFETQLQNYLKL
ncbi:TlpA family protein disulfide reductase [Pedobacter gandavensis]|uniref:Redoxin domain-containing protein n=1 Tax=Pedobacter gandavensis TaxID=2679963 RepID=A0ABR6EUF2_9SPHI|nr:TlpA family protein disulfide reductase [Pedobacter gandavensis]MBB2148677.1 redoxin domain-containing protein [Pedobacter gandavensis]